MTHQMFIFSSRIIKVTDLDFLRTCRIVYHEVSFFYHSVNTFYFTDLDRSLRFLISHSQSNREHIKNIKFRYRRSKYAYDAIDLLTFCVDLELLKIEMKMLNYLDFDSSETWSLHKIRGLRKLTEFRYVVTRQCWEILQREMKWKRMSLLLARQWRK